MEQDELLFPNEFVAPKDKDDPQYGLQYIKAMYYGYARHGARMLYNNDEYESLIELAQGRQSVDNIKKLFGYFVDPTLTTATSGDESSLAYIDLQVLNLAPKYINKVVASIHKRDYDIVVNAIDPLAKDEEKNFQSQIQTYYKLKDWMANIGIEAQELFTDLELAKIPEVPDDLLIEQQQSPQNQKTMEAEMTMKLLFSINNWKQISKELIFDLASLGKAGIRTYLDTNGIPRCERVKPQNALLSHSRSEFYKYLEYGGYIDYITVNEFLRDSSPYLNEDQQKVIVQAHASSNQYNNTRTISNYEDFNYDGLKYMPIINFAFLSENTRVYTIKKTQYDNIMLKEHPYNYYPSDSMMLADYDPIAGNKKLYKTRHTAVYGGKWIIDSDTVYGYGEIDLPPEGLVNKTIPFKFFAPNMQNGRVVSMLSQIVEPLYMINVAWNKIKDILAKGWMGVMEIDFSELEGISMGRGGKVWKAREVYEHFLQTKQLFRRKKKNQYDQTSGDAITEKQMGLTMQDYFTTLTTSVELIESITGISKLSDPGYTPPERQAVGTMVMAQENTNDALDYLFHAYESIFEQVAWDLLRLTQASIRKGNNIEGWIPALGKGTAKFWKVNKDFGLREYGLFLEMKPTEQQWAEFYGDLRIALEEDKISSEHSTSLRRIDNLKQGQALLAIYERKHRKLKVEEKRNEQKAVRDDQIAINNNATKNELAKITEEYNKKREIAILVEIEKRKTIYHQHKYNLELKDKDYSKAVDTITKAGIDGIVKQAVRNLGDKEKAQVMADAKEKTAS